MHLKMGADLALETCSLEYCHCYRTYIFISVVYCTLEDDGGKFRFANPQPLQKNERRNVSFKVTVRSFKPLFISLWVRCRYSQLVVASVANWFRYSQRVVASVANWYQYSQRVVDSVANWYRYSQRVVASDAD
jgi:hypothetical protein